MLLDSHAFAGIVARLTKLPHSFHIRCAFGRQTGTVENHHVRVHAWTGSKKTGSRRRSAKKRWQGSSRCRTAAARARPSPGAVAARARRAAATTAGRPGRGTDERRAVHDRGRAARRPRRRGHRDGHPPAARLRRRRHAGVGAVEEAARRTSATRSRQGQLLAEIDPTVYLSRVDANRAQLRTQQAQLTDREAQLALAEQQLSASRT